MFTSSSSTSPSQSHGKRTINVFVPLCVTDLDPDLESQIKQCSQMCLFFFFAPWHKEEKIMSPGERYLYFPFGTVEWNPREMKAFGSRSRCLKPYLRERGGKCENEQSSTTWPRAVSLRPAWCLSLCIGQDWAHCLQDYQASVRTSYKCKLWSCFCPDKVKV